MELLTIFALCVVLDMASLKWGRDSRNDINSPEWEKRLQTGRFL